jgi:DNA-entry nuclease
VTPFFKGEEPVARGVQMEAQSIEDDQISFNLFIYNVQDGIKIDYQNGYSQKE